MTLTLWDGVFQTRDLLGEQQPNFWSNSKIIADLNYAAQDMCSEAQIMETVIQFPWPNTPGTTVPIEEAPLPAWLDQILGVAVYSGQLFQLQACDAADVQVASKVGNIPLLFYTKTSADLLSPQGAGSNTGDISVFPIQPQLPYVPDYETVLGLWPVPTANYDTTISCTRFHPKMDKPLSRCAVPARFIRAWIAYAVARGKEKAEAYAEADRFDKIYETGKEAMRLYAISHKQLKTPAQYGGSAWPTLSRGSSSVVFIDQQPGLQNA